MWSNRSNRLGINYDNYYASEIDKYAIKVAKKNYPNTIHLGDVTKWKDWNIPNVDLLIGGSPCFVAGTKVLTKQGYLDIEKVSIGDQVLTHKLRYKKVLSVGKETKNTIELKAQGMIPTKTTESHPYYVRKMKRVWNNLERKYERTFSAPTWLNAGCMEKNDYVGVPIINNSENPLLLSEEDCWLLGRYVADGHISYRKRKERKNSYQYQIIYSIGSHKLEGFKNNVKRHYSCYSHSNSVHRCIISSVGFLKTIKTLNLGAIAHEKTIDSLLGLPVNLLKCVLDGYMSGDGSSKDGVFKATTVSRKLALSLNLAIAKVYRVNSGIEFTVRPKTTVIEGRTVNQRDTYTVSFRKEMRNQTHARVIDNVVWTPFRSKTDGEDSEVYNLEVDEDNSYTANNVIVHNCQGFSFAGKQLNFDDPRSKLFFEFVGILKEKKPKYFLLENVDMKQEYLNVISRYLGVSPVKINSSLVSAQNRERWYWTNIPGEEFTLFESRISQPKDKGILLKDIVHESEFEAVLKDHGNCRIKNNKSNCIDANYWKGQDNHAQRTSIIEWLNEYKVPFDKTLQILDKEVERGKVGFFRKDSQANRIYYIHDKAVTLCGDAGGGAAKMGQYLFGCITPDRIEKRQNGQRFNNGQKFYTLTTQDKHGILIEGYIRKLTPIECCRLQTVPDGYTNYVSNTQQYKMLGNGWTIDVICHILNGIK